MGVQRLGQLPRLASAGSGHTSKRFLGSFHYKNQQHDLMYGWKAEIHRLFVHIDLGADIAEDVAMVDGLAWRARKGEWGGSAMNLFEHSKLATGTDNLYIIISDLQGVQNPVILSLDWESEKPSVSIFVPTEISLTYLSKHFNLFKGIGKNYAVYKKKFL
jgi:hypothetical protein